MASRYSINLKFFTIILLFTSYLTGFFLRENIAGGAEQDFERFTWPLIEAFKINFYDTLTNYGSFGEGSLPLFHIINAYLNPFTSNKFFFQGSIAFISIFNAYIFSKIIERKFQLKKIDSFLYSSIFLILPFFRSSAFWGLTENLGWLLLLLSIKYFEDYRNKNFQNEIICIFYICFFSSLALYTRPYLVFFPIFLVLRSTLFKDFKFLKISIFYYSFFSIPGFFLIWLWGGSLNVGPNEADLLADYHNPKFILKNLIIFSSIFLLYIIPYEIGKIFQNDHRPKKNQILLFVFILIIIFTMNFFNIFDYLENVKLGGGAFLKLNQILFNDLYLFLFISSIGLFKILNYTYISKENLILFTSLIIFCFPRFILQEYFEPLIIILIFTLFDFKHSKKIFDSNITIAIFIIYFLLYYAGSFAYRYEFF
tara:strand:- start:5666 stop:6940 length:1275 start_codon:yes stop_codon:yes gene_type:complete